jgi:FkbM family methyltransferase
MKNLKSYLKILFRRFGFEVSHIKGRNDDKKLPQSPRRTMKESLENLRQLGFYPKTVIDVGAAHGTLPLLEAYPEAFFLLIEPLEEFTQSLKKIIKSYNAEYLPVAAGRCTGSITINVHDDFFGSSLYCENDGPIFDGSPRRVPLITLDKLRAEKKIQLPILLKVDVQGAELDVLAGGNILIPECDVIILETSFFSFLTGSLQFADVIAYMKDKDFVVYDIFGGHLRPFDGALAQVDLMFVKESSFLRKNKQWATAEQREKIIHRLKSSF